MATKMIHYPLIVPDGKDIYLIESARDIMYVLEPNDVVISGLNTAYDMRGNQYNLTVIEDSDEIQIVVSDSGHRRPEAIVELLIEFLTSQTDYLPANYQQEDLSSKTIDKLLQILRQIR